MTAITTNLLPGSIKYPAMATLIDRTSDYSVDTQVCKWNYCGYIPLLSTVSGCARAVLGAAHTITHLATIIFDLKGHLAEVKVGLYNVGRGMIEMLPVIGNIILLANDLISARKSCAIASKYKNDHSAECENEVFLFVDGEIVAKKSFDELNKLCKEHKFTKRPSFWEAVSLIQTPTQ